MSTIMASPRTALMFAPLYIGSFYTRLVSQGSAHSEVCSEVSGPACFMPVMEIKSVQCYAAHASENTMACP